MESCRTVIIQEMSEDNVARQWQPNKDNCQLVCVKSNVNVFVYC